jgi:hypothetical protein
VSISWKVSKHDDAIIRDIVARGWALDWLRASYASKADMHMDIVACHANGTPLKLQKLRDFDDFNFAHDMSGICRHLDRDTGKLGGCFVPRASCSRKFQLAA